MIQQVGVADTEDQSALAAAVAGLLARQWPADAVHKQIADPGAVSEQPLWSALAELGLAGLAVPEEQGGAGGTWSDLAVALEVTGAALAPLPAVAAAGALGALAGLGGAAAAELRASVAAGSLLAAPAWLADPGTAVARATGDGDAVRLTGEIDLLLSPEAGRLLLAAERSGEPLLVVVDTSAAGVAVDRVEGLDATRPLGRALLTDAPATVLASGADVAEAVGRGTATAGLALAAELVGTAGHCLTAAVGYAADRHQFGRPIGSFQAVKHRCAEMLAQVESARAATRRLATLLDAPAGGPGSDPAERDDALALALLQAGRAADGVANGYLQVCGGIGYTWEHEAHLHLRRAAVGAALLGGPGRQRRRLDPLGSRSGSGAADPDRLTGPAAELAGVVRELLPRHRERWGDDTSFTARLDWQKALHAAGWIAPQWPVEFGGRGLGIVDQVRCDRVLALLRAPAPLAGVLGVNNVAPTLMRFGTPEQKQHLAAIQSGEEVWCQGFSEPGSGSDLASLRTRAVIEGDGDDREFVITGQKVWTSEGMEADFCMLLVRTDPDAAAHRGISALLVPLDSPGVTRRPIVQITGESGFAEVFYDEVRVPYSALLGPLHEGWRVTMTTLGFERAGVIEMAAGLEQAVDDLVEEVLAGLDGRAPDAELRLELTERLVEARLCGLLGERALARIADGGAPGAEHSVIKLLWARALQHQGETALGALGVRGVSGATGQAAQRTYLSSRAATIAGGTGEIMLNILAERVLEMPR